MESSPPHEEIRAGSAARLFPPPCTDNVSLFIPLVKMAGKIVFRSPSDHKKRARFYAMNAEMPIYLNDKRAGRVV